MRQYLFAFLAALVALLASGCRTRGFVSPYDLAAPPPATATIDDVRALLVERAAPHEKLWVRADLVIRQEGRRGKDAVTGTLIYRAPDFYRLRGSREIIGPLFEVYLRGNRAVLFMNRDDLKFVGTPRELQDRLGTAGNLMPEDFRASVLVQQEMLARMADPARWSVTRIDDRMLFATVDEDGRQRFYRVRPADGLIDEYLMRSPAGEPLLRVTFQEYRLVDVRGRLEPLPWLFEVEVPSTGTRIAADVDEYKIDPPIGPGTEREPEATRVHPMSQLSFEPPTSDRSP